MIRVAWLTCALLAVADARIYGRCELARELHALGVHPDHISTWVCIAYHESRFDTAANNPHSGDHGIFQISELYWCGPGKACGVPCAALRDEDISNDLECALQVHEEHTRLQGNGFLAWVVYPQHCKHNTKKYLVDCDITVKNPVPVTRSRAYNYQSFYNQPNVTYSRQNIDELLPSYLTIGSIVREYYGKVLGNQEGRTDLYNYKIDNVDELKLPVFNQPSQAISMPPTARTSTTTTTYVPPVMPWRRIETNQFRKKQLFKDNSVETPTTWKENTDELKKITQTTKSAAMSELPILTTIRPFIAITPKLTTNVTSTATTTSRPTTVSTTYKPPTSTISQRSTATTVVPWRFTTTTYRPPTTTTRKPMSTTTTKRPTTFRTWNSATTKNLTVTTNEAHTQKPKFSWYTFTSRATTTAPTTTKSQTVAQIRTNQPFSYSKLHTEAQTRPTQAVSFSTTTKKPPTTTQKPRSTQSIFDLYLHPTKPPKLPPFKYNWNSGGSALKIFSDGTTTLAPNIRHSTTRREQDFNGTARNYIKRQTLRDSFNT